MEEKVEMLELRKFHDDTWSVMARVWTPEKRFYEHPTLINLTEKEAKKQCDELLKEPPLVRDVLRTWLLIGH